MIHTSRARRNMWSKPMDSLSLTKSTHRKTFTDFGLSFEQKIKNHYSQPKTSSFSKSFSAKNRARIGSSFLTARRPVTGRVTRFGPSGALSLCSVRRAAEAVDSRGQAGVRAPAARRTHAPLLQARAAAALFQRRVRQDLQVRARRRDAPEGTHGRLE